MEALNEDMYSGKAIDHLGLVADVIDQLGIIGRIDARLPLQPGCGSKVSHGERIAAMIINGLGFIDTRLYMFPEFLGNKPIASLFGKELDPSWFNDDAIGRCLDAVAQYGTTKLFTELSFGIGVDKKLLGRSAHFDTSTLQLYGEYSVDESLVDKSSNSDNASEPPMPARGYSKSHRHDLKQMVITLATTGTANFPIWMESQSGNASDKKILPAAAKRMQDLCKQLEDAPEFLYVGDSAIYSNILQYSGDMKWLTRVPENILPAKQLLMKADKDFDWHILEEGYSYHVTESDYGGVQQRWILVFSKQGYEREIKTLEKNIAKELDRAKREWWHLSNDVFTCHADAQKKVQQLAKELRYHKVNFTIVEITGHSLRGRPQADAKPTVKGYRIEFNLIPDDDKIAQAKLKKGRFILSTNEFNKEILPDNAVLPEYKRQAGTESGFKFIKDNTFEVDSVFLKTPSRIDALMMVMTLCLMVYGYTQHELRTQLQAKEETLPNQKRKPTQKPSLKWIYFLFSGVHELTIMFANTSKQIVINVNETLKQIVSYFGPRAQAIYLNTT
jgi:transposase